MDAIAGRNEIVNPAADQAGAQQRQRLFPSMARSRIGGDR
jgi:hypothetical protein